MTLQAKSVLALVGAVIIGLAIWGGYQYPRMATVGSPAGATFGTAKIAAINFTPSTAAASSTSILNTDTSTRYVTDNFVDCNGTNGQGLTIQAATTSVSSQGLQGNSNLVANTFGTTSTTATNFFVGSTTPPAIPGVGLLWPSNTYLTFISTSSAINTGICTVGVHYIGS